MASVNARELVCAFQKCVTNSDVNDVAAQAVDFLLTVGSQSRETLHSQLCAAMCKVAACESESGGEQCRKLLFVTGEGNALSAVIDNITKCPTRVAEWLAKQCSEILSSSALVLCHCSRNHNTALTPLQEHLIGCICRVPDLISNALKHSLEPSWLPGPLFTTLAGTIVHSLDGIYDSIKGSVSCSTVFLAALIGKLAILGQKDVIFSVLVPALEKRTQSDPLWQRIAQTLFSHIPDSGLELVLDGVMMYSTPTLVQPTSVQRLLGDLILLNPKAKFLLTHKAIFVKVPHRRKFLFNLVGYLSSDKLSRAMLVDSLVSVLEVWGSASALRHMDHRQHMWLSQLLVLSTHYLKEEDILVVGPKLQKCVMVAIQTHIDSSVKHIRQIGMVVGEHLMNWLNPRASHPLAFEYEPCPEAGDLQKLTRLSSVQEELASLSIISDLSLPPSLQSSSPVLVQPTRLGEGLVATAACAENDSDDDLVPHALGDDPDSEKPFPPQYLRTCIAALVTPDNPAQFEAALGNVESLVRHIPPDVSEVSVELAKVLLHLSDTYALDDFTSLRHRAMVAIAVTCPLHVVPYFTSEFYSANYSLQQRIDILEVLSAAALELSAPPLSVVASSKSQTASSERKSGEEDIVKERLKSKTKIISKGPTKTPHTAAPNRFASVAPLFLFPLMNPYDKPINTLDLLGEDSLVLGSLVHTLGVIIHASINAPLISRMAASLMDFLWGLRYHQSHYVRQSVLFALAMLMEVMYMPVLVSELEGELLEVIQWLSDIAERDSDKECRSLARHILASLQTSLQAVKLSSQ